jgi:hypothetical protein
VTALTAADLPLSNFETVLTMTRAVRRRQTSAETRVECLERDP